MTLKRTLVTLALMALLVVASLAAVGLSGGSKGLAAVLPGATSHEHGHAGADESKLHGGHAGDHDAQTGMDRPAFPDATGSVPSAEQAESLDQLTSIFVDGDKGFRPSNGIRSGSGTLDDPFVISGYRVSGDLHITDTDACFVVFGNWIDGQLTLNWNGQCVHMHHNHIRDLRVNENNQRVGYATGGLLEANEIVVVGQLRHYDGEFRHNVVGPFVPADLFDQVLETTPLLAADQLVANIDGFNQGIIHHNTFHGSVDLDLHGHHHGTGFYSPHSHYHGDNETKMELHPHDHTDRWTSVAFTDNKVVDPTGYGVRYEDQNHAGDDQTANSESTEQLEMPHVHHTQVAISRNVVEGQIVVDVFNADDELHKERNPGWLEVADNQVTFQEAEPQGPLDAFGLGFGTPVQGIRFGPYPMVIEAAKEVETRITGNTLTYIPRERTSESDPLGLGQLLDPTSGQETAGIRLLGVKDAVVTISGNTIRGATYGILAQDMDEDVQWSVDGNDIDAATQVYYDESVANRPSGSNAA